MRTFKLAILLSVLSLPVNAMDSTVENDNYEDVNDTRMCKDLFVDSFVAALGLGTSFGSGCYFLNHFIKGPIDKSTLGSLVVWLSSSCVGGHFLEKTDEDLDYLYSKSYSGSKLQKAFDHFTMAMGYVAGMTIGGLCITDAIGNFKKLFRI